MGIQKLQKKAEALSICPSLTIIDGSDLEEYRDASRIIYAAFRNSVKELNAENITKKGGMDEYFADLTVSVHQKEQRQNVDPEVRGRLSTVNTIPLPEGIWVYGNYGKLQVQLTEDQSGATSKSVWNGYDDRAALEMWGTEYERTSCIHKLHVAAAMAKQIQDNVKSATKFSTTVGISVSPMLAKIASDLKKPKSCNILFPWRSLSIIDAMPLRKIPSLGSKTLRLIMPALARYNVQKDPMFWTCHDLLNVPQHAIQSCLGNDKDGRLCDLLIKRCRGIDPLPLADDEGGLVKTVSVEDSFIRGSLMSMEQVKKNLEILFGRIIRLMDKRKTVSPSPQNAYPKTIRITARIVDVALKNSGRRPFRTISKQTVFHNGKLFMETEKIHERVGILRRCTMPLLQMLSDLGTGLNITRFNLAAVSFADIRVTNKGEVCCSKSQKDVFNYFQSSSRIVHEKLVDKSANRNSQKDMDTASSSKFSKSFKRTYMQGFAKAASKQYVLKRKSTIGFKLERPAKVTNLKKETESKTFRSHKKQTPIARCDIQNVSEVPAGIDPSAFAALPTDLAKEVLTNQRFHQTITWNKKKSTGIQQYFFKK